MKKRGKFEKVPEPVPVKQKQEKTVKNALLQTYFVSLLSLVLCVTMFLGTSYAWFTSEVNNTANEIYVGTLKVGLLKETDAGVQDLATGDIKLFDKNIRWEPGYTMLETVKVINKGDLAFHYVLSLTDGTITAAEGKDTTLDTAAGAFDVWVYEGSYTKDPADTFAAMIAKEGWKRVGTLAEVLNGTAVVTNQMDKEAVKATSQTEHTYTIAVHMNEAASAQDIMGSKIKLNVKLIAYQMSEETDALGNAYDEVTVVLNAAALKEACAAGKNVLLGNDITIKEAEDLPVMDGGTLDGNGKTLTYSGENNVENILKTNGGTIRNLKIEAGSNACALYSGELTKDLYVADCEFSGKSAFALAAAENDSHAVRFTDTTFDGAVTCDKAANTVDFNECTFKGSLQIAGNAVLRNCTFTSQTLDTSALKSGATIILKNCTYGGKVINATIACDSSNNKAVTKSAEDKNTYTLTIESDKLVVE